MPSKITLLKSLLGLSAAGGAALFVVSVTGPKVDSGLVSAVSRSPAAAASHSDSGNRFYEPEAGYRYVYAFRRRIQFQGNLGGASMPPVDFRGELFLDVLRADPRAFEAVVTEKVEGAPAPRAPFLRLEADARGDQLSLFSVPGLSEDDRQHAAVAKDLLALWLFPLRSDTVGPFEARFEPLPAETGFARERKTKLSYLRATRNTPTLLSSLHELLWDFGLRLPKEVKGAESTRLGAGPSALVAESRYELVYRAREKSPALDHAALNALREPNALALDTSKPSLAEHPDYANLDWGKILSGLRGLDKLTGNQQLALFGDAVKYLRLHPERLGDLFALLRDPALLQLGATSPLFRNLVGVLATLATPEALAALREAYDDPHLDAGGKGTILAAFTTTQAPLDATTREFLTQKMETEPDRRLAQSAAFALGSALQNAGNDEQSRRAVQQFQVSLAAAKSLSERLALLDVMGNSGRAEFLPALEGAMRAGDSPESVKARAVFALRFIPGQAAAQDLVTSLAAPSEVMREAAAGAMQVATWSETFRAPLEKCAAGEPVMRIQDLCRKVLGDNPRLASSP